MTSLRIKFVYKSYLLITTKNNVMITCHEVIMRFFEVVGDKTPYYCVDFCNVKKGSF